MKTRTKIAFFLFIVLLSALTLLFVFRRHSVVFSLHDDGDHLGEPAFVILNPFRDRDPERRAERFMTELSTYKCMDDITPLRQEYAVSICREEHEHPAKRLRLANRRD